MKARRLIVVLTVVIAGLVAAATIAERNAEASARALCGQFPAGSDFGEALRIAATQGERQLATADSITVFHVGVPPFSRHACEIRGAAGKVVASRYSYLD